MLSAERFSGLKGTFLPMAELAGLTWMRVGGPADWLFSPQDISDLQTFLKPVSYTHLTLPTSG